MNDFYQLFYDVGVSGRYVGVLVNVGSKVEQLALAVVNIKFPITFADGHLVGFMKFPIQEVVFYLLACA